MITTLTAYTYEVDDIDAAVSEILDQLELEKNLLKNRVGIVHCSTDFVDSGVFRALCAKLPFNVAGITTVGSAVHDEIGEIILTIMVLTSDSVNFNIGLTDPITSRNEAVLRNAYEKAVANLSGKPALAISYFPLSTAVFGAGGDFVAFTLSQISGGVPVFGTMPIDNTHDFHEARILCNGNDYYDRFAFILIQAENLIPRFYLISISDEDIRKERGTVTNAQGNLLYSVDDMPILEYLKNKLGLALDEKDPSSVHMIPLLMDFGDGATPVVRAMNNFNNENVAVCSGELIKGVTLLTGRFNKEIVLRTTAQILQKILNAEKDANGLLIYSCAARYWTLGLDSTAELEIMRDSLAKSAIPYLTGYSCGELCPVKNPNGELISRMHNYTFIACAF
ncbi:MAG: FIST C-terminal domain-containing protein [Planctomycetaceae bacterium]|nr:FIST C-terminal domain-containing protein [Planctomycetaceae bacterium]